MRSTLKLGKRKKIEFEPIYSISVSNENGNFRSAIAFYPKDLSDIGRIRTEMNFAEFENFVRVANEVLKEAKNNYLKK